LVRLGDARASQQSGPLASPSAGTRLLASQLVDPEAKAAILKIADEYDRLAERALNRQEEEGAPK
jgi:hypothetical protein